MNTEEACRLSAEVLRRSRMHAALADPARLRIVDALALGDLSPSDLQRRIGIGSNLLAHHLGRLQEAGLIARHRSEADRRRTYLQLDPAALAGLAPDVFQPWVHVPRVVFVCTANTARSQLASALWAEASTVPATSAGTHPADAIAPETTATAKRHGLRLGRVKPRPLGDVLQPGDFVITVCDNAHEELDREPPPERIIRRLHWSVPDPTRAGTVHAFDAAYEDLLRRITHLATRLVAA